VWSLKAGSRGENPIPVTIRKQSLKDLAIFGGEPAFPEHLHVGRPNVGDRERLFERIDDILSRRWLTNHGPYVCELERRIADLQAVKHCVVTCNGTIALQIGIRALGLSGEVILPSFTFVATAHALEWLGITPVFCDVSASDHNIDPRQVEKLITPRTSGIMGVHLWGRPCDVASLEEIAARHRIHLMFDAAHAFACSYNQRMIGNFGSLEVLSFHATKFFNTFEGGAIVTNDDLVATRARQMRDYGYDRNDDVVSGGTNGKMNEVSAAMGLTGLESLDEFMAANRRNNQDYRTQLANLPGVRMAAFDEEESNCQYVVVEIDESQSGIGRDRLMEVLHAEKVLARRYFYPGCHRGEPYRSRYPALRLPVTEALCERVLTLPTGTAVEAETVAAICDLIRFAVRHGSEISESALPRRKTNRNVPKSDLAVDAILS
jgi:dTDP-4-amino-4,6-dideoxygalactose transaminase